MLIPKRYAKSEKNIDRAYRALDGLHGYRDGEPLSDAETVQDFLCDLRHYCRQNRLDFDKLNNTAELHYEVESTDKTGEN